MDVDGHDILFHIFDTAGKVRMCTWSITWPFRKVDHSIQLRLHQATLYSLDCIKQRFDMSHELPEMSLSPPPSADAF